MPQSTPRSILVTGGAGFIGSNFVALAIRVLPDVIVNLDKLTYAGSLESLARLKSNPRHVFVQGDIGDAPALARLLEQRRPGAIVNFAAETHVDRSIAGPALFVETNVVGTFRMLQTVREYWERLGGAERAAFRFLQVSTDEVYGTLGPDDPAFSERTPYAPNSPYAASKAAADHFVRAYHHTYGLPVVTTNCSNNYGPYQYPEKLIPLMILNALEGKPLPVYGDGKQVRDWLFVEDHCEAILAVLQRGRPGETYSIGGRAERANLDVVHALCAALDELAPQSKFKPHAQLIRHVADRPGHDRRYAIDGSKIRAELGWSPRETLETGLARTVKWYLDNPAWVASVRGKGYAQWIETNYARRAAPRGAP
jgi:dTDP-glucose 4,6-dehydratase